MFFVSSGSFIHYVNLFAYSFASVNANANASASAGASAGARRWNAMCVLQHVVEGMRCAIRKVSLRVAQGGGPGEVCGSDLVCSRLGEWWPPAFPPSSGLGLIAFGIPPSAAAGALATTGKKLTERLAAPCVFLYTGHPLCKQACNGLSGYKKSPQALLESFFPLLR